MKQLFIAALLSSFALSDAIASETGGKFDAVVRADGGFTIGRVVALTGDTLRYQDHAGAAQTLARDELRIINFAIGQKGGEPDPPQATRSARDLVVPYDGRALLTRVQAITADTVVSTETTLRRGAVDLIVFGQDQPSSPAAKTTDFQICPPDKPLGARLEWSHEQGGPICQRTVHTKARLKFDVVPPFPKAPADKDDETAVTKPLLTYAFRATEVTLEETASECEDVDWYNEDIVCTAPDARFAGTHRPTFAYYRPFQPGLFLLPKPEPAPDFIKCETSTYTSTRPDSVPRAHAFQAAHLPDGRYHFFPRVAPGPCWKAGTLNAKDECRKHPERFLVLPFTGVHEDHNPQARTGGAPILNWVRYKWNVCCGCGAAPETETAEKDGDDDCLSGLRAMAQYWYVELQQRWESYRKALKTTPYDLPVADNPANREKFVEFFASFESLADGIERRYRELMDHYRACQACAEKQGLDPSHCPRPERGDYMEHPDL